MEIAKKFHEAGATVIVLDREDTLLKQVKESFPTWTAIQVNLLDWEGTKKSLESLEACHHLVNNAGVNVRQDLLEITPENIDFIFGVNFKAIVNVTQVMVKKMIEKNIKGTVVHISSYVFFKNYLHF